MSDNASVDILGGNAQSRLHSFVERLERLEVDRQAVMADMKEVFSEAKGEGFDVKILRMVMKIRSQDRAKRLEQEAILDLYLAALGMV